MRIPCPICGERDVREFYYSGAASLLNRPSPNQDMQTWDNFLHNRENPEGLTRDLWYHTAGCTKWIVVTRNTATHMIIDAELVRGTLGK